MILTRRVLCDGNNAMILFQGWRGALLGIFAATALHPVSSPAIVIRDDRLDGDYLNLAAGADYAAVGRFVNDWGFNGSGVLIAPDWVLTAAHNLVLATAGTFTINGNPYTSTQLIRHPSYQNSNPFGGFDLGLVKLSSPVAGVTPATLYDGSAELAQMAVFVGYGFKGTGLTGYQALDNQKRAFQNMIDGNFGNPAVLLGSDFDNPHSPADSDFGDVTPLNLEGSVAPGDSGGGVFLTVGSQTYLAGVISFVAGRDGNANGDYGDVTAFGRVAAFNPWIMSTIPEPAVTVLLAGAGLAVLIGRRFRRASK